MSFVCDAKFYRIKLSSKERWTLATLTPSGKKIAAREMTKARALLLADELVELEIVDSISHETVRAAMKEKSSNRG